MSNTRIVVEYRGKRYCCNNKTSCHSKRNCDLFRRGVCDAEEFGYDAHMPCDGICDAFIAICGGCPDCCFKEIKEK